MRQRARQCRVSLGLTTEAVVAQRPINDGAPIVETLQRGSVCH